MMKGEVVIFALRRSVCYITENRDRKQLRDPITFFFRHTPFSSLLHAFKNRVKGIAHIMSSDELRKRAIEVFHSALCEY